MEILLTLISFDLRCRQFVVLRGPRHAFKHFSISSSLQSRAQSNAKFTNHSFEFQPKRNRGYLLVRGSSISIYLSRGARPPKVN